MTVPYCIASKLHSTVTETMLLHLAKNRNRLLIAQIAGCLQCRQIVSEVFYSFQVNIIKDVENLIPTSTHDIFRE